MTTRFIVDGGIGDMGQVTVTGAALLVNGTTVFTIAGGPIRITDLVSYCIVGGDAAAATLQWNADGTVGAAVTISGASAALTSAAAGGIVYCNFTALSTAPILATAGVALAGTTTSTGGGVYVPAGIITMIIGGADTTTATYKHYMRWVPLGQGASVTAAF